MSGITWELLDRYLAHECATAERELIEQWLELDSTRTLISESLSAAVGTAMQPRLAGQFHRRFAWLTATPLEGLQVIRPGVLKVAALAAVVIGMVLVGWRAHLWTSPPLPEAPAIRAATTPPGQRATFNLADGTRVMLGVASTLRSPAVFGPATREVALSGEALFEVAADAHRPFVVTAADVIARDMGTSFLVRAYPEEVHARIVVREGKVAIRAVRDPDTANESLIAPGQLGRLAEDGSLIVEWADTAAYFSWTEGRLSLDNIPLRDALPQLSRWWDVDFRLADSALGEIHLTAALGPQLSPDMLDLLAHSLGMRQKRTGRTVTFFPDSGIH